MQVPSQVEYERATSVDHALSLLSRPETRVVAGGHSLIPMMKLRLAQPEVLVDINELAELAVIRREGDQLCIGALARHAALLSAALAGEHFPIFHDAERVVADPIVRLWGTVGGSLCQADPSEEGNPKRAERHEIPPAALLPDRIHEPQPDAARHEDCGVGERQRQRHGPCHCP